MWYPKKAVNVVDSFVLHFELLEMVRQCGVLLKECKVVIMHFPAYSVFSS